MTNYVTDVTEADFQAAVIEGSKTVPVVVDFWASWCQPCKTLGPILERAANESGGAFRLAKVDVDANPRLAQAFGVQGIPTVVGFRDGQPVTQFTGAIPEAAVRQFLAQLIPPPVDPRVEEAEALADAGDVPGAEAKLTALLAEQPANLEAALALAGLLLDRGATTEALELLARQSPTPEVRRLEAAARLMAAGDIDLANPSSALPALLEQVEAGGDEREKARLAMLDLFDILGPDDPLTGQYRRRLASALF
ncbi:MAG TPA: thioredoxin [Acidimicrobiia bacterium]|jgi:putative thioredoxin|nr:thioredoxin [Acidimicrobiia bacterium]